MASDVQQTPFLKQLAANDRPTRDKAVSSLQTYLKSNRTFTDLELLKLWKGLFFCMWHSDRPIPQQRLALSLSHLLLPLPIPLFIPFLRAFWLTIAREWSSVDVLRMDKFLRLVRYYVNASFTYLSAHTWDSSLVADYVLVIGDIPLSPTDRKVPDGLRYHVLDVWVEELDSVDREKKEDCPVDEIMEPVRRLEKAGATKMVRERARETLGDQRLRDWSGGGGKEGPDGEVDGEEWEGLDH